jgi:hypothetical protein
MKAIAFYLPQFHPIPENDAWWGKGFTEWTNVVKARPLFPGHCQPRVPADLGFYDLRLEETRIAQAALAQEHGISGFCYYHYWFNDRMLLERPFNEVLASGKPDFPFCLCWANENWTRRWDGMDQEILLQQDYAKYDPAAHIDWLSKAFADRRYITIHGKPLFLVYYADHMPDVGKKVSAWKKATMEKGFPGLYLCAVRSYRFRLTEDECFKMGFDAIVDFQPNPKDYPRSDNHYRDLFRRYVNRLIDLVGMNNVVGKLSEYNQFDYAKLVDAVMSKPVPKYTTFPCVFPSWDNSPRKKYQSTIIQNNDAELYGKWLADAFTKIRHQPTEEQIVFINAWNEWAEGCYLEPDCRNNRAFLEATKQVLTRVQGS